MQLTTRINVTDPSVPAASRPKRPFLVIRCRRIWEGAGPSKPGPAADTASPHRMSWCHATIAEPAAGEDRAIAVGDLDPENLCVISPGVVEPSGFLPGTRWLARSVLGNCTAQARALLAHQQSATRTEPVARRIGHRSARRQPRTSARNSICWQRRRIPRPVSVGKNASIAETSSGKKMHPAE